MIISGLATFLRDQHVNLEDILEYYPVTQEVSNPKKIEVMNKYFIMDGQMTKKGLQHDRLVWYLFQKLSKLRK